MQLLFPFDLEEPAPHLAYVEADIGVTVHDSDVIARQLTAVRYDDPGGLGALTTFGDGRGDFRWRLRPGPAGPLTDGSRVARVLLQVPHGTGSLTGTISVAATLSDIELGVDVPIATRKSQPFVLSLRDGTFSPLTPTTSALASASDPAIRAASVPADSPVRAGVRRMCVTVDVEGYSKRDAREHGRVQSVLLEVLDRALSAAQISGNGCDRQQQGDGHLLVMPPAIDEPQVIRWFLRELASGLGAVNRHARPEYAVRMRVALDEDIVFVEANGFGGHGVVRAHRLRDSTEARSALAEARSDLIVIVSDRLYLGSVRAAFEGEPEWRFERAMATVPDKGFAEPCWIHVPAAHGAE